MSGILIENCNSSEFSDFTVIGKGGITAKGCDNSSFTRFFTLSANAVQKLKNDFPQLRGVAPEALAEASEAVTTCQKEDAQSVLKSTRLGRWLIGQGFAEWAALTATILQLCKG